MMQSGDDLMSIVQRRLDELNRNPFEAARAGDLERSFVNDIVKGRKRSINFNNLPKLAKALALDPDVLQRFADLKTPGVAEAPASFGAPRDSVPIYFTKERQDGVLVVDPESTRSEERPSILARIPSAYILVVSGECVAPAFRPGERALVHPKLPLLRGEDYVIRQAAKGGAAIIREVVKYDRETIVVRQLSPPADIPMSRKAWPITHRIVGKFART